MKPRDVAVWTTTGSTPYEDATLTLVSDVQAFDSFLAQAADDRRALVAAMRNYRLDDYPESMIVGWGEWN